MLEITEFCTSDISWEGFLLMNMPHSTELHRYFPKFSLQLKLSWLEPLDEWSILILFTAAGNNFNCILMSNLRMNLSSFTGNIVSKTQLTWYGKKCTKIATQSHKVTEKFLLKGQLLNTKMLTVLLFKVLDEQNTPLCPTSLSLM